MRWLWRLLAYAWPAPNTCAGLALGLLIILFGGSGRLRSGALEFGGGALGRWISGSSFPFGAVTIGHVVLGLDHALLESVRAHERVHVRQYERWGPLFIPAYLVASALAVLHGGHYYQDNAFEREAFAKGDG